jgi:hypothetical protein
MARGRIVSLRPGKRQKATGVALEALDLNQDRIGSPLTRFTQPLIARVGGPPWRSKLGNAGSIEFSPAPA